MTKLRREKKLIPQEQKGLGDKGRRRFDTWSTAVSEMSPTPTTRPALIFKALSPADSTGPLPSSFIPHYCVSCNSEHFNFFDLDFFPLALTFTITAAFG